jgi:hypothetical protein
MGELCIDRSASRGSFLEWILYYIKTEWSSWLHALTFDIKIVRDSLWKSSYKLLENVWLSKRKVEVVMQ